MFNNFSLHSCLNIARDKLHNSTSSSNREDVRLCRWVLLKNSISSAMSRAIPERTPSPACHDPFEKEIPTDEAEVFVFPDGDIFAESFVSDDDPQHGSNESAGTASEAQWLDSLLESLADDDDADFEHEPDDELVSLSDISARSVEVSTPQIAPESIFLPPSPPLPPIQCSLYRYRTSQLLSSCDRPSVSDEIEELSLPDVVEDSASDTDSESLNTPDARSMSSLNEVSVRSPMVRIIDESAHGPVITPYPYFSLPVFTNNEFSQQC